MRFFTELGRWIAVKWSKADYSSDALPDIALAAFDCFTPALCCSLEDIFDWYTSGFELPAPVDEREFGQPTLCLYRHEKFSVEANFWLESTPAIHGHGFSGAFYVLQGPSLHTQYEFDEKQRPNHNLQFGHLGRTKLEVLRAGAARAVRSGDQGIHSLFHLANPSVSLVIRTHVDHHALPQMTYAPPSIAFFQGHGGATQRKRLALLPAMFAASERQAFARVSKRFEEVDQLEAYEILSLLTRRRLLTPPQIVELAERLRSRYPRAIAPILSAIWHELRQTPLIARRKLATTFESQLLLGLLCVADDRAEMARVFETQTSKPFDEPAMVAALSPLFGQQMSRDAPVTFYFDGFGCGGEDPTVPPPPVRVRCPSLYLDAALRGTALDSLLDKIHNIPGSGEVSPENVANIVGLLRTISMLRPLFD